MLTRALGVRIIYNCGMVNASLLNLLHYLICNTIIRMQGVNNVLIVVMSVMICQLMKDVSNVIYGVKIKYASMIIKILLNIAQLDVINAMQVLNHN